MLAEGANQLGIDPPAQLTQVLYDTAGYIQCQVLAARSIASQDAV